MKMWKAAIILVVAVLTAAGTALAAPVRIGSITDGIEAPTRVALDAQGNVYVSETFRNRVSKFTAQGARVGTILVPYPYGVAVSASGTVYVCSLQVPSRANGYVNKSSVLTYSPNLAPTGSLGAAEGEFAGPMDIEIDGSGNIFVVDKARGVVKVFNAQGAFQYSIGSGYLTAGDNGPQGIAIDEAAGEVFVADTIKTNVVNPGGSGLTDAPRISVFTKNGAFLRSFGQYGSAEVGSMNKVSELAVDRAGVLYVADIGDNVVHTFSTANGSVVGEGGISAGTAALPAAGVAFSRNNLLLVAWSPTQSRGRVDIFGLDGFVTMNAAPRTLSFDARQYGANPPAQVVRITNAGTGTLNWSAAASNDWILLGQQDPAGPSGSANLAVGVDTSRLTMGSYQGIVTVTSDYGQKADIGVSLAVLPPLALSISNGSPSFTVKAGGSAVSQTVTIGIDGGSGTWSLGTAGLPAWLSVSPTSGGAAPTVVTLTVNPAGLAADATYTASIPVAAADVTLSGTITVSLKVNASSRISVTTNRADASFRITGPASFSGTGTSWSADTAPAGDYTVTFDRVVGFKKPFAQTKTLGATGSISFNGTYVSFADLAARKNIVVAKGPDAESDSQVRAFKNTGAATAFDLIALATKFGASVAVGDVDGDGAADLIAGAGNGQNVPATVRVYRVADKSLIAEFVPFGTLSGVRVAAGDIDGDGKAEVLVSDNVGSIAVYTYANATGKMAPAGMTLEGTAAAVADLAGNGRPAAVTVSKDGLKIWSIDLSRGAAAVASEASLPGASVAAADMDGDGKDEIIVGAASTANGRAAVTIMKADGTQTKFKVFEKNSVNVAAADLDGDGIAEIIVGVAADGEAAGRGKMERRREVVQVYGSDGSQKFMIKPFEDAKDGVTIAVGDLGL